MLDEHEDLVGIAPFVVIPGNDFDERIRKSDTCVLVEDGRARVAEEVGRNNGVFGVAENALEFAFGSSLHRSADFVILRRFREIDREVNNGNVEGRNAHGHTGELAVEFRKDFADSLSRARGGRDDVAGSSATAAPILLDGPSTVFCVAVVE